MSSLLVIDDQQALPSGGALTRHHLGSGGAHSPALITGTEQKTRSELSTMRAKEPIKGTQPRLGDQRGFSGGKP